MTAARGRQLRPGQTSRVHVYDVVAGASRVVFESDTVLVEAPNVLDERTLILNGDGDLFTLELPDDAATVLDATALRRVPMVGVPEINNDHVLDPSGASIVVSARDGDLYRVALPRGTDEAPATRITDVAAALPVQRKFYLHGIAPDGSALAAIVGELAEDGTWTTDVALVDPLTGEPSFVTRDAAPDDGCAFTPDGSALLFNSERFSPGSAELVGIELAGAEPRPGAAVFRITEDERVNWFPHVSPDGAWLLYLSYPPGTTGHPEDRDVELRILPGVVAYDREAHPGAVVVARLQGGQGTINVPPWAPSSRWFAYVDYPV